MRNIAIKSILVITVLTFTGCGKDGGDAAEKSQRASEAVVDGGASGTIEVALPEREYRGARVPAEIAEGKVSDKTPIHDCEEIYMALSRVSVQKTNYETDEEYAARKSLAEKGKFYGSISVSDNVAFKMKVFANPDSTYNIKKKAFTILPTYESIDGRVDYLILRDSRGRESKPDNPVKYFAMGESSEESEDYAATNGFGATISARKTDVRSCGISTSGRNSKLLNEVYIYASPEEAKALQFNVSALVIGRIVAPYHRYVSLIESATFDHPHERKSTSYVIPMDVQKVIYYSNIDGKILAINE